MGSKLDKEQEGESKQVSFRAPPKLLAAIDAEVERRNREDPSTRVQRSDLVRQAVWRAFLPTPITATHPVPPIPAPQPAPTVAELAPAIRAVEEKAHEQMKATATAKRTKKPTAKKPRRSRR